MLYLHVSNRTEKLLEHLAEVIRVSARRDVFEKEVFLIQSQGMERMISQTLADAFRSWCNFDFLLPVGFFNLIAERLGMQITPDGYERQILAWRLEELLRDLEGDAYIPLQTYISGENAALKRYQLARQLSNVFDQYQLMRPDMLAAWQGGEVVGSQPSEEWQMLLWQRLSRQQEGMTHRGILLQQVIDTLMGGEDLSVQLPQRVSVFGVHILPPLFLSYLHGLARHSDVHLYVLSPCQHYWGDIDNKRRLLRQRIAAMEQGGAVPEEVLDTQHPLLASLGQQGREFQEMLLNDATFEIEFNNFVDPLDDQHPTLLHTLQSDLLAGAVQARAEHSPVGDDGSIQIVSCHSRLRELHVLKDHILHLLHNDPDLELRDIVVMAPDIQEYSALIPAVFDDLQHSIADKSMRNRNVFMNGFVTFFELFKGRFGWSELFDLLQKPEVHPHFELTRSDLDALRHWVTASGIRWGLSATQRGEMGFAEFHENSWSAGIERMLMGYAIDTESVVDTILPFTDIEGGAARALGGLCRFVTLFERGLVDFAQEYNLVEWSQLLLHYSELLFGDRDDKELLELRSTLTELATSYGAFHTSAVNVAVIQEWLEQAAQETRSSSGFLRGQLTFCSMLPMRSIPFQAICLIGLNDGVFPKTDRHATFDLMGSSGRLGDRSLRADDRYQFLEVLLAVRDSVYLSYIGQSLKTNEPIPPSVVITELLELLHNSYQLDDLVVCHPLHPFSEKYFSSSPANLYSYNSSACEVAQRLQQPPGDTVPWWSGVRAFEETQIVLADLFRFYANPQRFFVQHCLGIHLERGEELPEDRETFSPGGLERYGVDQALIEALQQGQDPQQVYLRSCATGNWPLGTPGKLAFSRRLAELTPFVAKIDMLGLGNVVPDVTVDMNVAGCQLTGNMDNIYENGILLTRYATMKGKDLLAGLLHYLLYQQVTGTSLTTHVIASDTSARIHSGMEGLPSLATMVELFVDGCRQPSPLFVEPALDYARQYVSPRAKKAPLVKARETLKNCLKNGYEPEWLLLLGPDVADDCLGDSFEQLCHELMVGLVGGSNG